MSEHLPRHRLEEWVGKRGASASVSAGRSASEALELAHLVACAQCEARVRAIEQARAAFLAQSPAPELARAVMSRESRLQTSSREPQQPRVRSLWSSWRPLALVAGFAVSVAVVLLSVRPFSGSDLAPDAIRFKGGASLAVYAKQDGHITPLRDGDALAAGTQLAFVCSLARPQHLLLLSIDDKGQISRYFPQDAALAQKLEPGTRVQLPIAIELDQHRGAERLFGFFSDAALDEARVRRALSANYTDARARGLPLSQLSHIQTQGMQAEQVSLWYRKP